MLFSHCSPNRSHRISLPESVKSSCRKSHSGSQISQHDVWPTPRIQLIWQHLGAKESKMGKKSEDLDGFMIIQPSCMMVLMIQQEQVTVLTSKNGNSSQPSWEVQPWDWALSATQKGWLQHQNLEFHDWGCPARHGGTPRWMLYFMEDPIFIEADDGNNLHERNGWWLGVPRCLSVSAQEYPAPKTPIDTPRTISVFAKARSAAFAAGFWWPPGMGMTLISPEKIRHLPEPGS